MAQIVLGIGSSHTPMLNAPVEDWPRFIERDRMRPHLDKAGNPVTYTELEKLAPPDIATQLTPEMMAQRHSAAMAELDRLRHALRDARLDVLIIVGDDQKELYFDDNMPSILVYRGETIRNVPLREFPGPDWARRASSRYYETQGPREFPVHTGLAQHVIDHLVEQQFDIACADRLPEGQGEGHAFGFVHKRLLDEASPLPVLPVFLNTYYPPNQPTPGRCLKLGRAIHDAVLAWPGDLRVGVLASGGLSHFTVDEDLDHRVMDALRIRDEAALASIPRNLLNSGNSEIRNWLCMAGASWHLQLRSMNYLPCYRTPAGTGTGLCFGVWT